MGSANITDQKIKIYLLTSVVKKRNSSVLLLILLLSIRPASRHESRKFEFGGFYIFKLFLHFTTNLEKFCYELKKFSWYLLSQYIEA